MLKNENFLKAVDVCKITRYQFMYSRIAISDLLFTQSLTPNICMMEFQMKGKICCAFH